MGGIVWFLYFFHIIDCNIFWLNICHGDKASAIIDCNEAKCLININLTMTIWIVRVIDI